MRGHKANPLNAGHSTDLLQQPGKADGMLQALAVGVYILAQKHDFNDPVRCQPFHLFQNVRRPAAPLPPPHIGHDAIGAEIIAAEADIHAGFPGHFPFLGQILHHLPGSIPDFKYPFSLLQPLRQKGRETIKIMSAEHHIHKRVSPAYPLHLICFLHHAAAKSDKLGRVFPLHAV